MTVEEQKKMCLPLIEEERTAYIEAEFGRLQGVMNSEYWDEDSGMYLIFHAIPELNEELGQMGDPYELTVSELAILPTLEKRIERMHTYSYMELYPEFPRDRERLSLLGKMKEKLDLGIGCSDEEIEKLTDGHNDFVRYKKEDGVAVIM